MSNLSVSDASEFTLLQELMTRKGNDGEKLFSLNTLDINGNGSFLITGISVLRPIYITEKKQEPIPGSQVPPIKNSFGEEE